MSEEKQYKTFTVTVTDTAQERYQQACDALAELDHWLADSDTLEELARRQFKVNLMRQSFHAEWGRRTGIGNAYDGDLSICADMIPLSWFFRYTSGFHGGIVFHQDRAEEGVVVGTWSTHT